MNIDIEQLSQDIIDVAKHLHQKNLLAAADGNISYRYSDKNILITPSGRNKNFLKADEMAELDLDNNAIKGKPSSESLMHLQIYKSCPEAKCVVHAHPPTAIAWTIAFPDMHEIPTDCMSELIIATGGLPVADYARPGTQAMGEVLEPYLPKHRAMILARHGAIAWGESLEEAVNGIERIEHSLEILFKAKQLGPLTSLPDEEFQALKNIRKNLGNKLI